MSVDAVARWAIGDFSTRSERNFYESERPKTQIEQDRRDSLQRKAATLMIGGEVTSPPIHHPRRGSTNPFVDPREEFQLMVQVSSQPGTSVPTGLGHQQLFFPNIDYLLTRPPLAIE